jgi:hypothetical protein
MECVENRDPRLLLSFWAKRKDRLCGLENAEVVGLSFGANACFDACFPVAQALRTSASI